jgi:hypothetical protein
MKQWLGWSAIVLLIIIGIGLIVGTVGGIHDNIQFKDWFSVTMWAVFGPTGSSLALVGAICLALKLSN